MSDGGRQGPRAGVVDVVKQVLGGESVDVYLVGRAALSERQSLRFVADQAARSDRPGFAVDMQPEKYQIRGGLAGDELDELFRGAAADRVERDFKVAAKNWLNGAPFTAPSGIPKPAAALLAQTATVERGISLAELLSSGELRKFAESDAVRPAPLLSPLRPQSERSSRR
ncbi:hypothetical protein [Burkholderia cenocepacia]|uniref:hypothetical protein n=1 Tax=Burkholderia cenocepacia TaxID=95486 RepID=UPI0013DF708E|nr:hypothetical protein [Burkholderia cenocepacia]MCW3587419.1 hypothetical protein [Burkholderia cenocepacia]MCW3633885.1 hypothetical protein [Burkholderia cenocepacia]MCW5184787.1 hypothetical protein [Burkholderia cenocepacia]NGO98017.1 hypothetical protein [Burkholderia cenocepacia]